MYRIDERIIVREDGWSIILPKFIVDEFPDYYKDLSIVAQTTNDEKTYNLYAFNKFFNNYCWQSSILTTEWFLNLDIGYYTSYLMNWDNPYFSWPMIFEIKLKKD